MRLAIGTLALSLLLAAGVGCSSKPSQQQGDNSAPSQDNSASGNSMAAPGATNSQSTPAVPSTVTVPAGRVLTVRLSDEVGSKISQPGQSFGGSLAKAVDQIKCPSFSRLVCRYFSLWGLGTILIGTCSMISNP